MTPLAAPLHLNAMCNERSRKKLLNPEKKVCLAPLPLLPLGDGLNGLVLLNTADSEASLLRFSIHLILIYLSKSKLIGLRNGPRSR